MSSPEFSEAIGRGLKIAVLAVVLLIGMAIGWYARGFLMIDRCLDRGGSWNEETLECEGASGSPEATMESRGYSAPANGSMVSLLRAIARISRAKIGRWKGYSAYQYSVPVSPRGAKTAVWRRSVFFPSPGSFSH